MSVTIRDPVEVLLVALPDTAGSALYGMVDVLSSAGWLWQTMAGAEVGPPSFRVRVVAESMAPFRCGNRIPVIPDTSFAAAAGAAIVVLPELWLGPDASLRGRYPEVIEWLRAQHACGAMLYAACSGTLLLAETGLLDGLPATSHWGYETVFQRDYPQIEFRSGPNLVFADRLGRIVTAGGTTSWHDLALHIIARHASPGEAIRVAKVYLMKMHAEGKRPFSNLLVHSSHADAIVNECKAWLAEHMSRDDAVSGVIAHCGLPERTMKRRFKAATGSSLIKHVQCLRIDKARQLLEHGARTVEEVSAAVGYDDASFFRRLFKRCVGLTPGQYRRLYHGIK